MVILSTWYIIACRTCILAALLLIFGTDSIEISLPHMSRRYDPEASALLDHEATRKKLPENAIACSNEPISPKLGLSPSSEQSRRPLYLHRRVIGPFIIVFVIIIATIMVLTQISNRNNGIATSFLGLHYLWSYGPTAILTLVVAFWNRVGFQAMLMAPWFRLYKKPRDIEEAFLLDYLSMPLPLVVLRSFRSRDFLVATTSLTSLIFSVLIVLSTGLITLSPTPVTLDNIPIVLQTAFANNSTKLDNVGSLAWLTMVGLVKGSLKNPDGVTEHFAYQTFNSTQPTTAQVRATVDGISTGLDCETASLGHLSSLNTQEQVMIATLSTPTCVVNAQFEGVWVGHSLEEPSFVGNGYVGRLFQVSCAGSTDIHDQRIMAFFGLLHARPQPGYDVYNSSNFQMSNVTVLRSAQLLCTPTYNFSPVDVVKNGSQVQSVTRSTRQDPVSLDNIDAWDIAHAYFDSHQNGVAINGKFSDSSWNLTVCGEYLDVDPPSNIALSDSNKLQCPLDSLLQPEYFTKYITAHYRRYTAVLAHLSISEPTSVPSTGTAVVIENRLLVREFAAYFMVGLLATIVFLSAGVFMLASKVPSLEWIPNTMIAQAVLLARSRHLRHASQHIKSAMPQLLIAEARDKSFDPRMSTDTNYLIIPSKRFARDAKTPTRGEKEIGVSPITIRKPIKAVACLVVVGVISVLEITLDTSNKNSGLGSVGNDVYLHYLWTTIPSIVMSLLSLYFSAVDFNIRALTPYNFLKVGAPFNLTIKLNLLDKSAPRIVFEQLQIGAFSGLAAAIAMFTANLLTIFTSSLFIATAVPQSTSSQLHTNNSFLTSNLGFIDNFDGITSASLVLEANLSYPDFTYRNLVIPGLAISPEFVAASESRKSHASSLLISNATVSAFRTGLRCKLYDSSNFRIKFIPKDESLGDPDSLFIGIQGVYNELGEGSQGADQLFQWGLSSPAQQEGTFGLTPGYYTSNYQYLYVWGNYDFSVPNNFTFASGMTCNDTLEAVDIETTFKGTSLDIDILNPPVPIESTVRSVTPSQTDLTFSGYKLGGGDMYSWFPSIAGPSNLLDPFFSIATTSRYALPFSALRDPTRIEEVVNAVKLHQSIITAAMLTTQSRIPYNNTNATIHSSGHDPSVFNVTVTDPIGPTRVIQDTTSTRILQSLLAVILISTIVSWVLMPNPALLPKPPTSIASTVALLIEGNIFACLPPNAASINDEELKSYFLSLGFDLFQMDWVVVTGDDGIEERKRLIVYAIPSKAN